MNLRNFALNLAYYLNGKAKRANQRANEEYACALGNGRCTDGNTGSIEEDAAWRECQQTARLADECADVVAELEDVVAT